jgi:hypothetical protein
MYKTEREFMERNREELERQKKQMHEEGMKAMMEGGMFSVLSRMGLGPPMPPPSTEGKEPGKAVPVVVGENAKK